MTKEELQKALDETMDRLTSQRHSANGKRRYDASRLSNAFENGSQVWNALNRSSRLLFARYLTIPEALFPSLIDQAAGYDVDRNGAPYNEAWTRVLEWKKNWYSNYTKEVDLLLEKLCAENIGYSQLSGISDLRLAYGQHYSFESWYLLTHTTVTSYVDWRKTLQSEAVDILYRTIFTYSLA